MLAPVTRLQRDPDLLREDLEWSLLQRLPAVESLGSS